MKHFHVSSQAKTDLDEIWLFIAQDNLEAADQFHDLLFSKFLTLAKQPLMGRARDDIRPSIRAFPVGNYVIFYRDTLEFVEVVRVLHGARDIESIF